MSHPSTIRDEDIPPAVYQRRWYILGVLCSSLLVIRPAWDVPWTHATACRYP